MSATHHSGIHTLPLLLVMSAAKPHYHSELHPHYLPCQLHLHNVAITSCCAHYTLANAFQRLSIPPLLQPPMIFSTHTICHWSHPLLYCPTRPFRTHTVTHRRPYCLSYSLLTTLPDRNHSHYLLRPLHSLAFLHRV